MLIGPFTPQLSSAATVSASATATADSEATTITPAVPTSYSTAAPTSQGSPASSSPILSPTALPVDVQASATSSSTPPPAPPTSEAGIHATSVTSDTVPTPRKDPATPPPTVARPPDTNYLDQAVEKKQKAFLNEINALPSVALDASTNSASINNSSGGKVKSKDNTLTVGMKPESVPAFGGTGAAGGAKGESAKLHVKVDRKDLAKGDQKWKHKERPLAYVYDLNATKGDATRASVTTFQKEIALIWNIDLAELRAAGVEGWPLHAYTYDEEAEQWVELPSWWNQDTNQLVALTTHFSLKAVGSGFDKVNNYLPTLNGFEVDLQSGTASAAYPINLPTGPAGFGPTVSLTYSSGNVDRVDAGQQGSSSIGWGWSLSTSYIAASQHHFNDKHPWTVSIVSDGANGDLIKGTDGYWHTANESFAKIQFNEAANKWEAWDANGNYYLFDLTGHVADPYNGSPAIVTTRWMLHSATDTHGNTINYSYYYEEKGGAIFTSPITDPGQRTRAVYPREITYGGAGDGVDKVKVTFQIAGRTDVTAADQGAGDLVGATPIYQGKRVTRIDISRKQQTDGQFRILRSYTLNQDYSTVLGLNGEYPHLTLRSITPWGKDTSSDPQTPLQAQLPTTTFDYYDRSAAMGDWGHLYSVKNGYGGEVRFYYDRAAEDLNSGYRRVRAKRVKDGLGSPAPAGQSNPHDALYTYEYSGAATNGTNLSGESAVTKPLHEPFGEFRGFAWVREIDPSGQATEHYFGQDDYTKGREWRSQVGKAETFFFPMNTAPANNGNWTVAGRIDHLTAFNTGTDNYSWKMWAAPSSSATRNQTVFDGQDVASRFQIVGAGTGPDGFKLVGTWKLVNANGNGDYWGLKVSRRSNAGLGSYEYHATAIWKVGTNQGERVLTDVANPYVVRPFRLGPVALNEWYTVRLHTSPDGRFALELGRDARDHIIVTSRGAIASNSSATIPTFPTGQNWKFVQETTSTDGVEPGYQFLLDQQTETRTVFSQVDTWFAEMPPVGAAAADSNTWQPGRVNNVDGMVIHLGNVQEVWNATYGAACCELGRYLRTMAHYDYNDSYRNLTAVYEYGNVDANGDERTTFNGYHNLVNLPTRYLIGKKAWTHVYTGISSDALGANWMLDSRFVYDGSATWNYFAPNSKGDLVVSDRVNMRAGQSTGQVAAQRFRYDAYGNQDQITDANLHSTTKVYDPYYHAFALTTTLPNGRSETTTWDYTLDVPKSVTDMNNVTTETRYDGFGRPLKSWIPTGGLGSEAVPNEEYTFPGLNQTSVSVPFSIKYKVRLGTTAGSNEYTWQMRWYDGRGRTIQDVSPKLGATTIRVDTAYDVSGRVTKATLPFEATDVAADAYRWPTFLQPSVVKNYDGLGRLTWMENPDGSSHMYAYNWLNRVDDWDELRHGTFTYTDIYGRISTVLEYDSAAGSDYLPQGTPHHIATSYTYDVLDNLMSVRRNAWVLAPNTPVVTTMEYDGLGRKKAINDPDMGRWEYEYDAAGNITRQRDALYLSNPTQFSDHLLIIDYDAMNRPTAKYYGQAHKNANLADVRFYYDADRPGGPNVADADATRSWGRLRKAEVTGVDGQSSRANSHSYSYNPLGQLTQETINSALARNNSDYTIGYTYDLAGRLVTTTYPDPDATHETLNVRYNEQASGLPSQLVSNKTNGVHPVQGAWYNARGQLTQLNQGSDGPTSNLLKTAFTYDDASTKRGWLSRSLVTTGGGATLLDMNIIYDSNGNVKTVSQNAAGANSPTFTNSFTYDQKERLVSAQSTGTNGSASMWPAENYTFDDIHRMRTRTVGGVSNTYTYPATSGVGSHLDAPTTYQGATFEYDSNGNQVVRTKNGTREVRTFNPEGRVVKIDNGTTVSEYIYDANGQRLIKTVSQYAPTATSTPTSTPTRTKTPTPTPVNAASFVSQDIPTSMAPGDSADVSVTMLNTGETTWTNLYALAAAGGNLSPWSPNVVAIPSGVTVAPGQSYTFNFTVYAPTTEGTYGWYWAMKRLPATTFEESTPEFVSITVGSGGGDPCPECNPCPMCSGPSMLEGEPDAGSEQTFADVVPGSTFYEYVEAASNRGIVNGYADGTFRPEALATRGQFVKMVVLAFNIPMPASHGPSNTGAATGPTTQHFSDVPSSHPFYEYIEAAYAQGVLGGYADGTFKAEAPLTRGQAAKVVVLAAGLAEGLGTADLKNPTRQTFADVGPASTFYRYIEAARAYGILGGYADNTFRPGAHASRGQIAKVTYLAASAHEGTGPQTQGQSASNSDSVAVKSTATAATLATPLPADYVPNETGMEQDKDSESASIRSDANSIGIMSVSSSSGTLNTTSRTIYIGGVYEEDITPGSTTTRYTSYYKLDSRMVGLRRVVGASSTQYRIVGDHLNSTTLIVDTQNTPQVVQRTYSKPYGEIASSWSASGAGPTTLTSLGYTGQRLETDSGLMDYGARFYDPALSYFVSADTVSPMPGNPATRNRYNYVASNPLRYTDPTGHRHRPPPPTNPPPATKGDCETNTDTAHQEACKSFKDTLSTYGIDLKDYTEWSLEELAAVIGAIGAMMNAFDWTIDNFKEAMGGTVTLENRDLTNTGTNCQGHPACASGRSISFDLNALRNGSGQEGTNAYILRTMVHELAHVWDRSKPGLTLGEGMSWRTGAYSTFDEAGNETYHPYYDTANMEAPPTEYAYDSRAEDFAESVTAYVFDEEGLGPIRSAYIECQGGLVRGVVLPSCR